MRIAILSDTHIPTRLSDIPGKVYEVCGDADLVLHAGDHVQKSVITDLERIAPVKAVQGNMDGRELAHLPERLCLELEGFRICMAHGSGAPFKLEKRVLSWFSHRNPDIVVFGHTHSYMEKTIEGTLVSVQDGLKLESEFKINLNDHQIEPPGILFYRVEEVQDVTLEATLKLTPREQLVNSN